MFWGISTVAVLPFGVLFGFGALTAAVLSAVVLGLFYRANKTEAANCLGVYPLEGALFTVAVEIPTRGHLHNDGRTLVAAPAQHIQVPRHTVVLWKEEMS